jgi:cytochrome c-type biogenesis protein CcsB
VATLSHNLLIVAIVSYLFAMMCYAAEYAFGARGAIARVADHQAERVLVGAGAPVVPETDGVLAQTIQVTGPPSAPDRLGRFAPVAGRIAVILTWAGLAFHIGCLVTRGFAAHRVPWGNMYEFIIAVTLVASVAWLGLVSRRPSVRPLGLFVTFVLVVLLGLDDTVLYTTVAPLVPALNSYWLKIHVTLAISASGILMVGFCAAVLHLVRAGYERRIAESRPIGFPFTLGTRLPAADGLERLTFRIHAFAFPVWTLAIICGAIWAESAWGRYWGWDPKETWAFIAWVAYACYLHARATPSVKRTVASTLAVVGWAVMMANLFLVNIFVSGMHSYAGVK